MVGTAGVSLGAMGLVGVVAVRYRLTGRCSGPRYRPTGGVQQNEGTAV